LINIEIKTEKNETKAVRVRGHGNKKAGNDIVCAGVSAITQTTLSGLLHYGSRYIDWSINKGDLLIRIKDSIDHNTRDIFNYLLTTMILGLEAIRREYPDIVKIIFK